MRWSGSKLDSASGGGETDAPPLLLRVLGRPVPLWAVAALVIFFTLGTVSFAWYVKRSVFMADTRPLALAAIEIASFPTRVKEVYRELARSVSADGEFSYVRAAAPKQQLTDFVSVPSQLAIPVEGLVVRRGPAPAERGWRVLVGAFRIGGSIEDAALLLSPDLEIVRYWLLAEDGPTNENPAAPASDLTHGFDMLEDGSVIYTFYRGEALRRMDGCGRVVWTAPGRYHHAVTVDRSDSTVWTLLHGSHDDPAVDNRIVQLSVADGRVLRQFSMRDLIDANPTLDVLELRRTHADVPIQNLEKSPGIWLFDPFHLNDADPLPPDLAAAFPAFAPGDVVVSARETNLVFVVDPATLEIKWWRVGATVRQHDPDWLPDGRLSIFNNRASRAYSEIVAIDPASFAKDVTFDGRDIDFYARVGGKHQVLPSGAQLIASGWEGRIFEVSNTGELALEFYSVLRQEELVIGTMTEAIFLPETALDMGAFQCGE